MSFFTLGTMGTQRGRTPQLSFMRSSTSKAVVLESTVTDLSSGLGGSFTLSHSVVMSFAPAGWAAENIAAAISAARNFDAASFMAILLTRATGAGLRDHPRPRTSARQARGCSFRTIFSKAIFWFEGGSLVMWSLHLIHIVVVACEGGDL